MNNVRSRPTARPRPAALTPPINGVPEPSIDADELKKQQAPAKKSKFRLPPPPKLSFAYGSGDESAAAAKSDKASSSEAESSSIKDEEAGGSFTTSNPALTSSRTKLPPPPSLPIPVSSHQPQQAITSAYQRKHSTTTMNTTSTAVIDNGDDDVSNTISMITSKKSLPYSNPYQTSYKPSAWYSSSRHNQKMQQRLQNAFLVSVAILSIGVLRWNLHMHKEEMHHHRHHNHHYHDKKMNYDPHNHLHAMIGIVDNPAGFALYSNPIHEKQKENHADELFSRVPTVTMSNNRLIPQVGFGVAGHHIEHKDIPLIVSRLLQYASSENEGGGGIAMIDAVMDEGVAREDEKLESNMATTAVAVVGRAVNYFAKEGNRVLSSEDAAAVAKRSNGKSYDYENRLEVHLLVSLTGEQLGKDNTLKALSDLSAELNGLVPPIHDLDNLDASSWKANVVDRRVDTRLLVLLRLPYCRNTEHEVVPCALERGNLESIQKWVDSYGVLEKLYQSNILHGIGVDGATDGDLDLLLTHCQITPHLYRGDVSQALDGYGRKMGAHTSNEYLHVEHVLRDKNITFLASNVAGHVLEKKDQSPNALSLLELLGKILFRAHREMLASQEGVEQTITDTDQDYYSVPRLALAYLVRHGVVALPHAFKPEHLVDDSPESVGGLAEFLSDRRVAEIGAALKALVTGRDLEEDHGLGTEDEDAIAVVFHNQMGENVEIVRHFASDGHYDGNGVIPDGDSNVFLANTGDQFDVYHRGRIRGRHTVHAEKGGADDFTISLSTLDK
ncbi:hypothetical protein ACHAXN_012095 [Cyclotella atomus]